MKSRLRSLAPLLMLPVMVAAAAVEPTGMFKKIIAKHGTYLDSLDPMPCGGSTLSDDDEITIKQWFERVALWPNFRHMYPMGDWDTDVSSCRVPRDEAECLEALDRAGVPYERLEGVKDVFVPVRVTGPVSGVTFVTSGDLIMECEMAATLPALAEILVAQQITSVGVLSAYRPQSTYSFHSLGLALDFNWLKSEKFKRAMWLKIDYQQTPDEHTCSAKLTTPMAKTLKAVACDMWESKLYNTVLTPNYNEGHDNHFHVDLRPGDNRFFIR